MAIPAACQLQRRQLIILIVFLLFNAIILYCFSTTSAATLKVMFHFVRSQGAGQALFRVNVPIIDRTLAFVSTTNHTARPTTTKARVIPPTKARAIPATKVRVIPPNTFQHPSMSRYDEVILKDLMQVFVRTVSRANLTYFMYGGTLLGSYRHHGKIPWDDDIDLMLRYTEKEQLKRTLTALSPDYILSSNQPYRWKFHSKHSSKINRDDIDWKFPFLDICFYKENDTMIWDEDPGYAKAFSYDKSTVFPLILRPFWNMSLYAPKDTFHFITRNYDISQCLFNTYNHKKEQTVPGRRVKVPCKDLWPVFPFVFRNQIDYGVNETLRVGNMTMSWRVLTEEGTITS